MKWKHLLFVAAMLMCSAQVFSQPQKEAGQDNLLFLLRQPEHVNQALKTIGQLQHNTATTLQPGKIEIIVCGEAVTTLTTAESDEWVEKIKAYPNVSLVACGLSLNKFNKTEKDLRQGIGYTPNGFIRAFELQKQGYLSVEL